eukprot:XP_027299766.1 CD164 sialomucin-like 2 protein isoform X2 [Anas platyrhynchos]
MAPPCAGALRCALLCAFLCALLCAQGPAATRAGECGELQSCQTCTAGTASPNGSACVWVGCGAPQEPETWSCVQRGAATQGTCVLYNTTALCPALKSPTKEPPQPPSKEPVTHSPREWGWGAGGGNYGMGPASSLCVPWGGVSAAPLLGLH